jgi:hypothetical protein
MPWETFNETTPPHLCKAKTKERDSEWVMEAQAVPSDAQSSAAEMPVAGFHMQRACHRWPPICPQLQECKELKEAPLELHHRRIHGTTPPAPKLCTRGKGRGTGRGKAVGRQGKDKGGRASAGERKKPGGASTTGPTAVGARVTPILDPFAHIFALHTWTKSTHAYGSPPMEFTGPEPGCTHPYGRLPSVMGLFEKFWSPKLQRKIVCETNRYASEIIDDKAGTTRGGSERTPLGLDEFRAYISICLQMGVKKLPCRRLYWSRDEPLFHCPVIS